jgi:hypothetical protein
MAEISAAKHKSGPIKISASGEITAGFFADFSKYGRKVAELFLLCVLHIKALVTCRDILDNPGLNSTFLLLT